jgi:hypothetical protein
LRRASAALLDRGIELRSEVSAFYGYESLSLIRRVRSRNGSRFLIERGVRAASGQREQN